MPKNCNNCEQPIKRKLYKESRRVFCNQGCYSEFRKTKLPKEEHNNWKGGITPYEAHRRYVKKNPKRIAHLKARRYARKKNAEGSHTLEEWHQICKEAGFKCVFCKEEKKLTKDHIIPLSENGSDYISNIQPLCRNCNSRKWKFKHLRE